MGHELPKALRDDVRLLGELLGETLRRQEGQAIFDLVERVRALSKNARGGSDADFATLTQILGQMPVDEALPVARAFSHFLNLANIAEQHHRIRRRRAYQRDPARAAAARIVRRDASAAARGRHRRPIGCTRPSARCASSWCSRRTRPRSPAARCAEAQPHRRDAGRLRDRPDLTLAGAGRLHRRAAPRDRRGLGDRARSGSSGRRRSTRSRAAWSSSSRRLWDALPRYLRAARPGAARKHTGRGLPLDAAPIRFGSWIGGDRDGNPNVTPDVTRRPCLLVALAGRRPLPARGRRAARRAVARSDASAELRARVGDGRTSRTAQLLRDVRDAAARRRGACGRGIASRAADGAAVPRRLSRRRRARRAAARCAIARSTRPATACIADGRLADSCAASPPSG